MAKYIDLNDMLPPEELWSILSEFDDESTWDQTTVSSGECLSVPHTPWVFKNDIIRHFPSFFVSSINSGSFDQLQAFSKAFIDSQCATTWYMSSGAASYAKLPSTGTLYGPDQFLHLVLGCWVTFPDMILSLVASQIDSYDGASGRTKLMLNVDIAATKTAYLPCDLWLPPVDQLPVLYTASNALQLRAMVNRFHTTNTNSSAAKSASPHFSRLHVGANSTASPRRRVSAITEQFVHALHQCAVPTQRPIEIQLRGHFCCEFDGKNRIAQMSLCLVRA
jgi:hypothetical protein